MIRTLWPEPPPSWRRRTSLWAVLRTLPIVVVLSTVAGSLVALVNPHISAWVQVVVANTTGVCVWGGTILIRRLSAQRMSPLAAAFLAAVIAVTAGQSVFSVLVNHEPLFAWLRDPGQQWRPILTGLLFSFAAVIFVMRDRAASDYRADLEAQLRQVAEARQGETLARLALLQAQIEPHFLFNTLANVQSMIEREPRTAARMLEHLNRYLRAALGRTRLPTSTCAQEIELIGALLAIAEIRLGQRLRYTLELPTELCGARLPPLLLQPLVENALKHGIEPAVDGGSIEVKCSAREKELVLTVTDTGLGFQDRAPAGVGLSNIRARLESLYGAQGQLTLQRHAPRGTVAEITLPLTVEGS